MTTEVSTVVESFFTVLTAERLLLGVGPLVSVQRGVVREPLGEEITAIGLLPSGSPSEHTRPEAA